MRRNRTPNTECSICGKPLYRRPFEFREGKEFCCKGCRSELYKRKPEIWSVNLGKGHGWNKGMSLEAGDVLLYGRPRSEETKKNISDALTGKKRVDRIKRTCLECGKNFEVLPSLFRQGKGIFCGVKCATNYISSHREYKKGKDNPNYKRVTKFCEICGNPFEAKYYRRNDARFCGIECKNEGHRRFVVSNHMKTHDTDIEIILEKWLIENGIKYDKQLPVEAMTIPDFFIQPNICLYADGDYWHSFKKTKTRDARINRKLKERGFKVIRILGSKIKAGVRPVELLCEA